MTWLWTILLFGASLYVVVKAAGGFVHFAAKIARRLGVSEFVIGLTLVAIGTSLPELMNTIVSSVQGVSDVALGNILGSNMANMGLSIGVSILFASMVIRPELFRREIVLLSLGTILFVTLAANGVLSKLDGILLITSFGIYLAVVTRAFKDFAALISPVELRYFVQYLARIDRHVVEQYRKMRTKRFRKAAFDVVAAMGCAVALIFGSRYLLSSILSMASLLGVTSGAVAATIVAIGTTTPELSVSIASVRKGYHDMLFGNIIGSNIVNLLLIIGVGSLIQPIAVSQAVVWTMLPLLIAATLVLVIALSRPWKLYRPVGIIFLVLYATFLYSAWVA